VIPIDPLPSASKLVALYNCLRQSTVIVVLQEGSTITPLPISIEAVDGLSVGASSIDTIVDLDPLNLPNMVVGCTTSTWSWTTSGKL